jgi:hypothetical protein
MIEQTEYTATKQLDLLFDYGQHAKATRRRALKAKREPLIEKTLNAVRSCGERGATRDELAIMLDRGVQSVCQPVLNLLRDGAIVETAECRPTRWGKPAAVIVDARYAPKGGNAS